MGNPFAPRFGTFNSNESFDDGNALSAQLAGKSVLTAGEQSARNSDAAWALKLIDDFRSQTTGGAFPNMTRAKVADQLKIRANDPTKLNQADTYLCGVTSVIRAWAQDSPVDYAWLGIQLYNLGRGRLGKGAMLGQIIEPSMDLRRSGLPAGMEEADWIVLASVHETLTLKFGSRAQDAIGLLGGRRYTREEGVLHYRGWQTAEEVVGAYRAIGCRNVIDNTSYTSNKGIKDLEKANDYLRDGWRVSLLINDRLLYDNQIGTQALVATSDHWVGMLETVSVMGDYIFAFNVFSWGEKKRVPVRGDKIQVRDFIKEFYGFVAARMY